MTLDELRAVLSVVILGGAVYGFVRERQPPDVTALLALLALLLTGILTPAEAFGGFSHPATVSVAAILVLSAGLERTGALAFLARRVLAPFGRSEWLLTAVLMAVVAPISAFVNNTATVAVFLPAVLETCRRTGASPGRVLMPMAHAATFGGMCTLIGTSTNLVAHEYARSQGLPGFRMFELGRVGLAMLAAGTAYVLLVGRWFLPRDRSEPAPQPKEGPFLAEMVVTRDSPWIGRRIDASALFRDFDLEVLEVARGDAPLVAWFPLPCFEAGDRLRVRGPLDRLLAVEERGGLELHRPEGATPTPAAGAEERAPRALVEAVVLPSSRLLGRTLKEARFAEVHDAVVLGIRRPGEEPVERPSTTPIRAGDVLLLEGAPDPLSALGETPGFLVVRAREPVLERPDKLWIALGTIVAVVLVVSLGFLPIVTAATAGCAILMLTGCLRPREAYGAIDWSIVFLLAGSFALGTALEKTGVTAGVAETLALLGETAGPRTALVAFFVVSMLLSELISNSGTVALLAPVAVSTGVALGVNPTALLAAVTFGASAAFALPIGYQTSLMIYGPGGYAFKDFLRMGIALDLLLAIVALALIPRFWPL